VSAASSLHALTRRQSTLILRLLHDKKIREQEGAFVLEGAKSCDDLIRRNPQAILSLTMSPRYLGREDEAERTVRSRLAAPQFFCTDAVFDKLSDVESPQGLLAVVRQPHWDETFLLRQARVLGLYGDRLRDPANVGAIIRTAAALNLTGLWLSPDSADPFGPKVVRAAAGTVLTLPIFRDAEARAFAKHRCVMYSALVPQQGTVPLRSIGAIPSRLVIAVGNEGEGLADNIVHLSAVRFAIPLAREVESLNVASTAAIAAFYFSGLPSDCRVRADQPQQPA
jgi:TrmH family RNA methyltransferase